MEYSKITRANTKCIGKHIRFFDEIDSTQEEANRQLKKENVPTGTIFLADWQTAGRGTKMRKWYGTKGNNILMTIVLHTEWNIQKIQGLTIEIAKAIQTAIYELYGYTLEIKEPNDLLLNHKKICGILTQATTRKECVQHIVIGIGLNVNEEAFPEELQEIATSLKKEYKKTFCREEIIIKIIEQLEKNLYFQ